MKTWKPRVSILEVPQPGHVVDPLGQRLDVAVEHGGVRLEPQPVGGAVHLEPLLGGGLVVADLPAHPRGEDLGPAARDGGEAGVDELAQHLLERLAELLGEEVQLHRGVALDVQLGPGVPDPADGLEVVLPGKVGVEAGDDVHLGDPQRPLRDHVLAPPGRGTWCSPRWRACRRGGRTSRTCRWPRRRWWGSGGRCGCRRCGRRAGPRARGSRARPAPPGRGPRRATTASASVSRSEASTLSRMGPSPSRSRARLARAESIIPPWVRRGGGARSRPSGASARWGSPAGRGRGTPPCPPARRWSVGFE